MTLNNAFPRIALAVLLGFVPLAQAQVSVRIGELTQEPSNQETANVFKEDIGVRASKPYSAMAVVSDEKNKEDEKKRPVLVAFNDTPIETAQMVALRQKEEKKKQDLIALNGTPPENAQLVALREKEEKKRREFVALNGSPAEKAQLLALREKEKKQAELVALNEAKEKKEKEMLALNAAPQKRDEVALAKPQYIFNTNFLRGKNSGLDISDLLGSGVLPGTYPVLIYLNNRLKIKKDILFYKNTRTSMVEACIDSETLKALRVDTNAFFKDKPAPTNNTECLDFPLYVEQAKQSYDAGKFKLDLSIPQAYSLPAEQDYISPELWDYGVTAGFINYNATLSSSETSSNRHNSMAASLSNGINLFGWRYRNSSSIQKGTDNKFTFSSFTNYVEHDVDFLKAQVRIGDVFASSRLLDNVGIRGVQLTDDLAMQPGVDSAHRPIIRGMAETNATIEVRQLGFLLHTEKVPPGAFELTNINPAGNAGDLEVKIIEADGRERFLIVPWGTGAYMVKKGFFTYDMALGQYKQYDQSTKKMNVVNFDYTYGLFENLSVLGGVQMTEGYQGIGIGIGTNTFIGPIALDISHSRSTVENQLTKGSSVRLSYSKSWDEYGTTFSAASQRYSTQGFRSLTTHAQYLNAESGDIPQGTPKLSNTLAINQNLRDYGLGAIYVSLSDNSYWNSAGRSTSISAGYADNWRSLSYGLSLSQSRNLDARGIKADNSTSIGLSLSIPLGSTINPISFSTSVNSSTNSPISQTASASSSFTLMGETASYGLYGSGQEGRFNSFGANLSSRTPYIGYSLNASTGKNYTNIGGNFNGGIIAHAGGLNFSSTIGETVILADVAGQSGVEVNYSAKTGTNGYAVISGVSPYRLNQVLVGKNLPSDVELIDNGGVTAVPRRGAIVRANFQARTGRRIEFLVIKPDGEKAPFGTYLLDEKDNRLGVTDPFGKALLLLENDGGTVKVKWGEESCLAPYSLGEKNDKLYYEKMELFCGK